MCGESAVNQMSAVLISAWCCSVRCYFGCFLSFDRSGLVCDGTSGASECECGVKLRVAESHPFFFILILEGRSLGQGAATDSAWEASLLFLFVEVGDCAVPPPVELWRKARVACAVCRVRPSPFAASSLRRSKRNDVSSSFIFSVFHLRCSVGLVWFGFC